MIKYFVLLISISAFAIIPGIPRDDLSNKVLKIQFRRFRYNLGGLCTASAISRYKILTAGHCVKKYISRRPKFLKLKVNGRGYSIRKISVPEGFEELQKTYDQTISNKSDFTIILKNLSKIDIAIITLSRPLSNNIKFVSLDTEVSRSAEALLCGYGFSFFDNGIYSQNVPAKLLCGSNHYFYREGLLFIKGNLINTSNTQSLTAPGDSGSPLFNNNMKQIGVLSGITKNNLGDATSYYADLLNLKEFILKNR